MVGGSAGGRAIEDSFRRERAYGMEDGRAFGKKSSFCF